MALLSICETKRITYLAIILLPVSLLSALTIDFLIFRVEIVNRWSRLLIVSLMLYLSLRYTYESIRIELKHVSKIENYSFPTELKLSNKTIFYNDSLAIEHMYYHDIISFEFLSEDEKNILQNNEYLLVDLSLIK